MESEQTAYQIFKGPFFEISFPEHWVVEVIENIPAFYDPLGAGALQVVASRKETGYDLKSEMIKYMARHGMEYSDDAAVAYQTQNGLDCLATEFVREARFWLVQIMVRGDKLLIVTYNADETPGQELASLIGGMVQSIEIY